MKFTTKEPIVLASASPRRKELLAMLDIPFTIQVSEVNEVVHKGETVEQYVQRVAQLKANDVASRCPQHIIISADTIVEKDKKMLHKPISRDEAIAHLQQLSGNVHRVLTAVVVKEPNGTEHTLLEETTVFFKKLPLSLVEAYVDSGDPFDKAGGYGIQTKGMLFIERIEGDYQNVVGLPIASLAELLWAKNLLTIAEGSY